MFFVLFTALVVSSESARDVLQHTFALLSNVLADHYILCFVGVVTLAALCLVTRSKHSMTDAPGLLVMNSRIAETGSKAEIYTKLHATGGGSEADRVDNCQTMVNQYYDMATDFYEFGWGESFHFAPRNPNESFRESLARHEHYLALKMGLKRGDRVLDMGCGVGGPMREIASFSGANVVGINNNAYQVARGTAKNAKLGLSNQCSLVKGDFMNLPFEPATFNHAYAIEATCHAPDRTKCFRQVFNSLKPGGHFCVYEWVSTDKYDANNKEHRDVLHGIEVGNGLPTITPASGVTDALKAAGFIVEEVADLAIPPPRPHIKWYAPLEAKWSLSNFKATKVGIYLTSWMVTVMEALRLAPKGTAKMHKHLCTGAETLVKSAQLGIFTPMLFVKATKPLSRTTRQA